MDTNDNQMYDIGEPMGLAINQETLPGTALVVDGSDYTGADITLIACYDISGTIYYDEYIDEGVLRIVLFDELPDNPDVTPIATIDIYPTYDFPIDYTFENLAPGTYYVAAQIDLDYSGGPPSEGELDGYAINKTSVDDMDAIVITNSDVDNVNITLFEIPSTNNPPNPPADQYPGDEATDIGVDMDMVWYSSDPDGDAITYDVYFGDTDTPPLVSSDQSANTYDPGTMNYCTTYYWKIVVWDEHGASTAGPVWSFTTECPS